jgi:hypothetical protein
MTRHMSDARAGSCPRAQVTEVDWGDSAEFMPAMLHRGLELHRDRLKVPARRHARAPASV